MKLTREGAARLGRHESRGFPVGDFDFRPEDFDGCFQNGKGHVVLTINQAKELATKLKNNADFFFLQTGEFDYDTDELWQCLTDKIEQAEIFQIGEDYNKALNRVAEEFQKQAEKGNEVE